MYKWWSLIRVISIFAIDPYFGGNSSNSRINFYIEKTSHSSTLFRSDRISFSSYNRNGGRKRIVNHLWFCVNYLKCAWPCKRDFCSIEKKKRKQHLLKRWKLVNNTSGTVCFFSNKVFSSSLSLSLSLFKT